MSGRGKRDWRVFYTAPRAEKKCEERLLERHLEVLLPTYIEVRQWKDRKKKVEEPLFRNYIFARVDEKERIQVLQTQGIVTCVSFGGRPAVVPDEEIEQIRIAQTDPERLALYTAPLPEVGARVTIEEGPLKGLTGQVLDHRGQSEPMLVVQVSSIRQAFRVLVDAQWVRALDRHRVG